MRVQIGAFTGRLWNTVLGALRPSGTPVTQGFQSLRDQAPQQLIGEVDGRMPHSGNGQRFVV